MSAKSLKPGATGAYRFWQLIHLPEGRTLAIRTGNYSDGPGVPDLVTQGDVITPDEITPWFVCMGLLPTEAELKEVAYILNFMRVTKLREDIVENPPPPELKTVSKAIETIVNDAPKLIAMLQESISSASGGSPAIEIKRRIGLAYQMSELMKAALVVQKDPFVAPNGLPDDPRSYWHQDIIALSFFLENIAKRSGKILSLTKDEGPGVAFIVKALKRTRARPAVSEASVARAIQRHRKKPLPEYDRVAPEGSTKE